MMLPASVPPRTCHSLPAGAAPCCWCASAGSASIRRSQSLGRTSAGLSPTRELCRLAPQLECLSLWLRDADVQPPSTSVLLSQLTALTSLELETDSFAPSLTQAVSCLAQLCSLRLESSEALPDPAPLTALTGLTRLVLEERASDEEGLRILAAATFPRLVAYTVSALVVQACWEVCVRGG